MRKAIRPGDSFSTTRDGRKKAEGRMEVKMHNLLMLVGKWERLSNRLETEEQDPSRGRIELKLPLR